MGKKKMAKTLVLVVRNGFSYIAFWQFAAFFVLFLLAWVNEILDLPALFYGEKKTPPNIARGCLCSAGVLLAAVVTVGHTYVQQKHIIGGMLTICSYCHRIRIDEELWQRIESYLTRNPMLMLTHGICPDCYRKAVRSADEAT